jgi:replicative superfamily II helicase
LIELTNVRNQTAPYYIFPYSLKVVIKHAANLEPNKPGQVVGLITRTSTKYKMDVSKYNSWLELRLIQKSEAARPNFPR